MKRNYHYCDGELIVADVEELKDILKQNKQYLSNYEELAEDMDDPSFIARGNGFCDTKFSEDFIEHQILKYRQRIADLERWITEG